MYYCSAFLFILLKSESISTQIHQVIQLVHVLHPIVNVYLTLDRFKFLHDRIFNAYEIKTRHQPSHLARHSHWWLTSSPTYMCKRCPLRVNVYLVADIHKFSTNEHSRSWGSCTALAHRKERTTKSWPDKNERPGRTFLHHESPSMGHDKMTKIEDGEESGEDGEENYTAF